MESVKLRYGCVLILLFGCAFSQRVFDLTPKDIEVNPGEVVVLNCKVINPTGACVWLKDGGVKWSDSKYEYVGNSNTGDCTLKIMNASLADDDGFWQCQFPVYDGQPMLQTDMAKVTVRQAPLPPFIEYQDVQLANENLTVQSRTESILKCVSRKGNPPATLKWFIDDVDVTVTSRATTSNANDTDMLKTFKATSTLKYFFNKTHNRKPVRCEAYHKAYGSGSKEVTVRLDVHYKPTIKIEGPSRQNVEEGHSLSLNCIADGNPTPNVFWSKDHASYSSKANITFAKVSRTVAGNYHCRAKNEVGESQELGVMVNVNFAPRVLLVEPSKDFSANLYQTASMKCEAEGNPLPKYSWLQSVPGKPDVWQQRGNDATLTIHNVSYAHEGTYVCQVSNVINGKLHQVTSDKRIKLDVRGPPQILRDSENPPETLVVEKDEDAALNVIFCADPQPDKTYWEWGSVRLNSGMNLPRYIAKPLSKLNGQKDCYEAKLIVQHVENSDSRKYTFVTENGKGQAAVAVPLEVQEPVTMSAVIGIAISCLVLLVVVVLVVLYFLRREKCMFVRGRGFKPDSDNGSAGMSEELHNGQAIPPDALYTDVGERNEYENLGRNSHKTDNVVYADLDLQSLEASKNNAGGQTKMKPKQETTEYAEIQFTPKKSAIQADI